MERAVAVTPLDGRLRLAGTLEFSGVNHVLRPERIDAIVHGAREYLTGVDAAQSISDWCGLRPLHSGRAADHRLGPRRQGAVHRHRTTPCWA